MQIVNQTAVLLSTANITPYEQIERVGRTCYKSEDKATKGSAVAFCLQMKNNHHYAMLEHYMVHMAIKKDLGVTMKHNITVYNELKHKDFGKFIIWDNCTNVVYMSASFRTLLELLENVKIVEVVYNLSNALNNKFPELFPIKENFADNYDIKIFDTDEDFKADVMSNVDEWDVYDILRHHITHTVRFTTDRGVSHELVRHRPCSFAQESTRYCNYSKGKYGNEITVIKPCFYELDSEAYKLWVKGCEQDEETYMSLIGLGCKAQEARDSLPTSVKTELIMTATEEEWQHIINLRYHGTTGAPHPQMKEVMSMAYPKLIDASENRLK